MNYEHGKVGGKELLEKMYSRGVLNSGKKLTYAFAINMNEYEGWKEIGHGGGDAGFRTYATRFPEQQLGIVVFSNLGSFNSYGMAMQVADVLLPPKETKSQATTMADAAVLKKFPGRYVSSRGGIINLVLDNGKLFNRPVGQATGGTEWEIETAGDKLQIKNGPVLRVTYNSQDSVSRMLLENPNNTNEFFRQAEPVLKKEELSQYAGQFYNDETDAGYTVIVKDDKLFVRHRKFADAALTPLAGDQFRCDNWWMNNLKFIRDKKGIVTGFEVNAGRILHLQYNKIKSAAF
jgi:hypothetical protein